MPYAVKSLNSGRRRSGMAFTQEETILTDAEITDEIKADPYLVVSKVDEAPEAEPQAEAPAEPKAFHAWEPSGKPEKTRKQKKGK